MPSAAFDYRVRVSPRGRNVRLRVTVRHGLEVVVPRNYDTEKIPIILERKKHWIKAALEKAEAHRKFFEPEPVWRIPSEIKLAAIGQTWHVVTKATDVKSVSVREVGEGLLRVSGRIEDEGLCKDALTRWLMRKTRQYLVPRLDQLSVKTGLRHERTFVKRPKTRWASCSRRKSVSLNARLLFLTAEVVDYVMIHELCHLAEMNHSPRFWALVKSHCPQFRKLDTRLREMWKTIPRWASARG